MLQDGKTKVEAAGRIYGQFSRGNMTQDETLIAFINLAAEREKVWVMTIVTPDKVETFVLGHMPTDEESDQIIESYGEEGYVLSVVEATVDGPEGSQVFSSQHPA